MAKQPLEYMRITPFVLPVNWNWIDLQNRVKKYRKLPRREKAQRSSFFSEV